MFSSATQQKLDHYLASSPPALACFDADGTLWSGDIAEEFLRLLINDGSVPAAAWDIYERKLEDNPGEAYAYSVRVMGGLRESYVRQRSEDFFPTHEQHIYAPMRNLVHSLSAKGHEVSIVSASPRWLIEVAARSFGLDPAKTIAQAVHVEGELLTDRDVHPTMFRSGKVEAIAQRFKRMPAFSAGNSWSDVEMLEAATDLKLLINPTRLNKKEGDLSSYAHSKGWIIEHLSPQG